MKTLALALSSACMFLGSMSVYADHTDVDNIYVRQISHAGSGCSSGAIEPQLEDREGTIHLNVGSLGLVAEAGPGLSLSASRKFCQLLIDLAHPTNMQYRVVGVAYSGEVHLSSGATANIRTTSYFQGQRDQVSESLNIYGPEHTYFAEYSSFDSAEVWSPCGVNRALNIKIAASIRAFRGVSGYISLDGPLGFDPQSIILEFRRC